MSEYRFFDPNEPIFEIINPDTELHVRIFADGRVVGMDAFSTSVYVINRIPDAIMRAFRSRD